MIKCNRCGKMTPAGAFCQSCGTPLAGMVENESSQISSKMVYQDQPEVPAWLESLRASERPIAPVDNPVKTNFSPSELIDEGSLPSWMSSGRNDARSNTAANPSLPTYAAPFPDQSPDSEKGSSTGFQAQSLIDEKSLPSWMQAGNQMPFSTANAEGLSASSLVQQENLPDWMKTLQQPPSSPRGNGGQGNQAGQGFSAFPASGEPISPTSSVTSGFAARDLIDQQSLPSWMKSQSERAADNSASFSSNQNQNQTGQSEAAPGQQAFSASSLLDVDALPSWLREGNPTVNQSPRSNPNENGANSSASQNITQGAWPGAGAMASAAQASQQTPQVNAGASSEGGPFSAASFIDNNSLPTWLRSGQPANTFSDQPATPPAPRMGSPRVENMRVPSRPRGEVNPTDTSEMAANVFASMLGVASTAPNYPASGQPVDQSRQSNINGQAGQSTQSSYSYGQMEQPGQGQANAYPQWGQPSAPQSQANMSGALNAGGISNTPMGMGSNNAFPQNYNAGNSMSGNYTNTQYPGNAQGQMNSPLSNNRSLDGSSSMGNSSSSYYGNNARPMPDTSAQSPASNGIGESKNKKRSVFEAIREWLSR